MAGNDPLNMNRREGLSITQKLSISGWAFFLPAVILIVTFMFYPMVGGFVISLRTGSGIHARWAIGKNYLHMLEDRTLWIAIKNTLLYAAWQVPIMLFLALVLASILNNKKLKFRGVFRLLLFLPCTMSLVAYAIDFKLMFATNGIVNTELINLGLLKSGVNFLGTPSGARFVMILSLIWRWTGYNMIFYVVGLTNVDYALYEAAQIDGASAWQTFVHITTPTLKPIILLTVIMATNGNLQMFDEPFNLTRGGPGNATLSISQYIYQIAFQSVSNYGYASAIAFVLMIVIATLVLFQLKAGEKGDSNA